MDRLYKGLGALLKLLPERVQSSVVVKIVERPQRARPLDLEFTEIAAPIHYGQNQRNKAWLLGEGPLVLCIHGWGGGGSADLGKMARAIAAQGFTVAALDMTGHGASPGNAISFGRFIQDIADFSCSLNRPVYAAVGFSAGGLSMMAARAKKLLVAEKYVCISSPCKPYPPLILAEKKLGISAEVANRLRDYLSAEFGMPWDHITRQCFTPNQGEQLLLVYDETDRLIDCKNAESIAEQWVDATIFKTYGNKHRLVPEDDKVIDAIGRFLI
ncbi:MAG: alpha/beta hydrolase [Pseudomonadales bacterium]|nr:alpha/beta hydrolase [Pseudomonadales bacterium]